MAMRQRSVAQCAGSIPLTFIPSAFGVNLVRSPVAISPYKDGLGLPQRRPRVVRVRRRFPALSAAANGVGNGVTNVEEKGSTEGHQPEAVSFLTPGQRVHGSPVARFLRLAWMEWRLLVPALIAAVAASCCSIFQPLLFGRIIGVISRTEGLSYAVARQRLLMRVSRIATVYCIEVISTLCFVALTARVFDRACRRLREKLFEKTLHNDVGFFDETGRMEIERTIAADVKVVRNGVWNNLSRDRGIRAFLEVALGMVLCFTVTGTVGAPIFGILVPIVSTVVAQMGLRNGRIASRVETKESDVQFFLNERMRGLRTLKAFGAERRENLKLSEVLDGAEASAHKFGLSKAMTESANRISIYVTIVSFFITGGLMICAGKLTFELFSCLTGFIWILNFSMQGISYTITDAANVANSLKNIYSILDGAQEYRQTRRVPVLPPSSQAPAIQGEIQFENVVFHYPSRPEARVLNGITFTMKPGQMVALVGDSGGGKSTIAAMLSRFYAASSGQVMLDGVDIQSIPSEVYTKLISVVDQEPILFQGTIRENIAYGLPDEEVDEATIVRAAKEANAHDFITKLSNGYDTVWTPGSNVSGGQRQRIAIARSLVKSPRILVLDEATSALDQESERIVQQALERIMKSRTVLIIAHRLSTVRSADTILFVKDGQILERGSYDELFNKPGGYFRTLVQSASSLVKEKAPQL